MTVHLLERDARLCGHPLASLVLPKVLRVPPWAIGVWSERPAKLFLGGGEPVPLVLDSETDVITLLPEPAVQRRRIHVDLAEPPLGTRSALKGRAATSAGHSLSLEHASAATKKGWHGGRVDTKSSIPIIKSLRWVASEDHCWTFTLGVLDSADGYLSGDLYGHCDFGGYPDRHWSGHPGYSSNGSQKAGPPFV